MPPDNWDKIKDQFKQRDERLRNEWEQGQIIGAGRDDVDPFVRERLREEQEEPNDSDQSRGRRR